MGDPRHPGRRPSVHISNVALWVQSCGEERWPGINETMKGYAKSQFLQIRQIQQ
jgi:hypothetical protein